MATKVDPKRSEAGKKAADTRRKNREAAARREQEAANSSRNWNWLPWLLLVLVLILVALGLLIWRPWTTIAAATTPVVNPTEVPALLPTPVIPTEVPPTEVQPTEVPTEVPTPVPTEVPEPVAVTCDTPSIQAEVTLDGKQLSASGEYLDTILGKRMTFTSRRLLVSDKAWNDPLSAEELKTVEETWQSMQVCIPEGMWGTVFSGGFEQKLNRNETGVFMTLKPGLYEFKIRNGEIVLWYPDQDSFANNDLDRIVEQIKFGNFDIKGALAFFGVTADILPKIPSELVKERNVQIITAPDPTFK